MERRGFRALLNICLSFLVISFSHGKVLKEERFEIEKTKFFKHTGVIKLHDEPVLNMYWVKLEDGGYMLTGSVLEVEKKLTEGTIIPDCRYLTDMSIEELKEILIMEYGHTYYKIYVKSLNAIVEVNKEPFLYNPFRMNINPTVTSNIFEINRYLKRKVEEKLKTDESFKERFEQLKRSFIESGFSESEAERRAKIELAKIIDIKLKKWLPEEKLPKKLYLVCKRGYLDFMNNETTEINLYPVKLSVRREKSIKIISVEKENKDIKVDISFYPNFVSPSKKQIYLDLITMNPVEVSKKPKLIPEAYKKCPHLYIGGVLYYGENTYRGYYQMGLFPLNNKLYLNLLSYEPLDSYSVYIRLGYYCAYSKKENISLLNPAGSDFSKLTTVYQSFYTHREFLKKSGIESYTFKFKIVSPDGYESDTFSIDLP